MLGKMRPSNTGEHFPQKSSTPAIATSNTRITGGKKCITGKLDPSVPCDKFGVSVFHPFVVVFSSSALVLSP